MPKRKVKASSLHSVMATFFPTFFSLTSPLCFSSLFLLEAWDRPAQIGRGFFNLHSFCAAIAFVVPLCCDKSMGGGLTHCRPSCTHTYIYIYIYIYIYARRVLWYFLIKYSLKLKMKLNRRQCFFAGSAGPVSRFHPRRVKPFLPYSSARQWRIRLPSRFAASANSLPLSPSFCGPPAIHISRRNN